MVFCEYCKIFKNSFFIEQLWWLLLLYFGTFLDSCSDFYQINKNMPRVKYKENIVHSFVCLIRAEVAIQKGAWKLTTKTRRSSFEYLLVHWNFHHFSLLYALYTMYRVLPYSTSDNETSPISRVLIGWHLMFCWFTSPTCCNSPQKCTPVKYKNRKKAGFPFAT